MPPHALHQSDSSKHNPFGPKSVSEFCQRDHSATNKDGRTVLSSLWRRLTGTADHAQVETVADAYNCCVQSRRPIFERVPQVPSLEVSIIARRSRRTQENFSQKLANMFNFESDLYGGAGKLPCVGYRHSRVGAKEPKATSGFEHRSANHWPR